MQGSPAASAAPSVEAAHLAPASGGVARLARVAAPASAGAALGNNVKSRDQIGTHERNLSRFASKWAAANLLKGLSEADSKRVSHCGYVARQSEVELRRDTGHGKAHFAGLKTCASVWWCPCCSPRISAQRKDDLDRLLVGARAERLAVVMLTLTFRHDAGMRLAPTLAAFKRSFERLRQRREWRALPSCGLVVATEVTFGRNGWHPHLHVLMVMDCAADQAVQRVAALASVWLTCLQGQGLTGNAAAYQVQGASAAGAYVAKFGAAEEIALAGNKRGRQGSRSPWQLLDDARDGDKRAAAAWLEYAAAFKGRRQLVWSRGLKARFGVDEVEDEDAAAEGAADEAPTIETLRVWLGSSLRWRDARRRRCALTDAAEGGGNLDAAEYGLTDAARWRSLGGDLVIEPD